MALAAVLLAPSSPVTSDLTYEAYLKEGFVAGRYDIVEGIRVFMPGPTWRHQRVSYRIARLLHDYEEQAGTGLALSAPFDVLIRTTPKLQTRQPDVLFVTHTTLDLIGGVPQFGPLRVAPELVVEIISDTETERDLAEKLADFAAIGVKEAWIVRPPLRSVEVLTLTPNGVWVSAGVFGDSQSVASVVFADLTPLVADFFRP